MVDIRPMLGNDQNDNTLNFGNKLSVLGGDFLLAKASIELGKLENTEVVELMSKAIGDLAKGAFVEKTIPDQSDLLNWNLKEWERFMRAKKLTQILMSSNLKNILIQKIIFIQLNSKFFKVSENAWYVFLRLIFGKKMKFFFLITGHKNLKVH